MFPSLPEPTRPTANIRRPLEVARCVCNKAPTSPVPLYAQQLLTGPLLSIFVPNHIDSEYGTEDDGYIYTLSLFNPQEETQQHRQRTPPTIADADVVAATRDVLVMLQIYGPMIRTNTDNNKNNNPMHSFGDGARRMDSVLPSDTLRMIHEAGGELIQMQQTNNSNDNNI